MRDTFEEELRNNELIMPMEISERYKIMIGGHSEDLSEKELIEIQAMSGVLVNEMYLALLYKAQNMS